MIDCKLNSGSPFLKEGGSEANSTPLSIKQVDWLNHLLYEEKFILKSKDRSIVVALKAHQLFETLVFAYQLEYREVAALKRLAEKEISVKISIKGSTASKVVASSDFEKALDVDALVEFDSLPHDPLSVRDNQNFYRRVACNTIMQLLRQHHPEGIGRIDPNDFFDNLILFKDNSLFLISFAGIDFALPVPQEHTSLTRPLGSTFIHESLKIEIPFHEGRIQKDCSYLLKSDFPIDFEILKKIFLEKIIVIPNAQAIAYNGFERLSYSLTKGWTTLDLKPVQILIEDFHQRANRMKMQDVIVSGKTAYSEDPLDRFYRLVTKKYTGPYFALHAFINAFHLIAVFSDYGNLKAQETKKHFEKSFSEPKWIELFPEFVRVNFKGAGGLKHLVDYLTLIAPIIGFGYQNRTQIHLGKKYRVFGNQRKEDGFALVPAISFKEWKANYEALSKKMSRGFIECLFHPIIYSLSVDELSLEELVLVHYFARALTQEVLGPDEKEEIKELFPDFVQVIYKKPVLLNLIPVFSMKLGDLFDEKIDFPKWDKNQKEFFIQTLKNPDFFKFFPFIYCLFESSLEQYAEIFQAVKIQPVLKAQIENWIELVLFRSDLLDPKIYIRLLETGLKEYDDLNTFGVMKSQQDPILKALNQLDLDRDLDNRFWSSILERFHLTKESESLGELPFVLMENREIFCRFIEKIDFFDLSYRFKEKLIQVAKNQGDFKLAQGFFLTDQSLIDLWSIKDQLEFFSSFDSKKEIFTSIQSLFLRGFDQDPLFFDQVKKSGILSSLSVEEAVDLFFSLMKSDPVFSKPSIQALAIEDTFLIRMSSDKKVFRDRLIQTIEREAFPSEHSREIVQVLISNEKKETVSTKLLKLVLFCLDSLNLDKEEEILFKVVEIGEEKLIQIGTGKGDREKRGYLEFCRRTLKYNQKEKKNRLTQNWISHCLKILSTEDSIEECFVYVEQFSDSKMVIKEIEKKIETVTAFLPLETIGRFMAIAKKEEQLIQKMIMKMETIGQEEGIDLLYDQLYQEVSLEKKYKLIKKVASLGDWGHELILRWMVDWEKKGKESFSLDQYKKIAQFVVSTKSVRLMEAFFHHLMSRVNFHFLAPDEFFSYCLNFSDFSSLYFTIAWDKLFEKMSSENQKKLLLDPIFQMGGDRRTLFEMAVTDDRFLDSLFYFLQSAHQVSFKMPLSAIKPNYEKLVLNLLDREDCKARQVIKRYLILYKTVESGISIEIIRFLIQHISKFEKDFELIQEGFLYLYQRLDVKDQLCFLKEKIERKESIGDRRVREKFEAVFFDLIDKTPLIYLIDVFRLYMEKQVFSDEKNNRIIAAILVRALGERNDPVAFKMITSVQKKKFALIAEKDKKAIGLCIERRLSKIESKEEFFGVVAFFEKMAPFLVFDSFLSHLSLQIIIKFKELFHRDSKTLFELIGLTELVTQIEVHGKKKTKICKFNIEQQTLLQVNFFEAMDSIGEFPLFIMQEGLDQVIPKLSEICFSLLAQTNPDRAMALLNLENPGSFLKLTERIIELVVDKKSIDFPVDRLNRHFIELAKTVDFTTVKEDQDKRIHQGLIQGIVKTYPSGSSLKLKEEVLDLFISMLNGRLCHIVNAIAFSGSLFAKEIFCFELKDKIERFFISIIKSFDNFETIVKKNSLIHLVFERLALPAMEVEANIEQYCFALMQLTPRIITVSTEDEIPSYRIDIEKVILFYLEKLPIEVVGLEEEKDLEGVEDSARLFDLTKHEKQIFCLKIIKEKVLFLHEVPLRSGILIPLIRVFPKILLKLAQKGVLRIEDQITSIKGLESIFIMLKKEKSEFLYPYWDLIIQFCITDVSRFTQLLTLEEERTKPLSQLQTELFFMRVGLLFELGDPFFLTGCEKILEKLRWDQIEVVLSLIKRNQEWIKGRYERINLAIKVLYSISLNLKKETELDFLEKLYLTLVQFYGALISKVLSDPIYYQGFGFQYYLLTLYEALAEVLPAMVLSNLLPELVELAKLELRLLRPNRDYLNRILKQIKKIELISAANRFKEIVSECSKEEWMAGCEEYQELNALSESKQCSVS